MPAADLILGAGWPGPWRGIDPNAPPAIGFDVIAATAVTFGLLVARQWCRVDLLVIRPLLLVATAVAFTSLARSLR